MILTHQFEETNMPKDRAIDRIHHLVERAMDLARQGLVKESKILFEEAEDHARYLRAEFICH